MRLLAWSVMFGLASLSASACSQIDSELSDSSGQVSTAGTADTEFPGGLRCPGNKYADQVEVLEETRSTSLEATIEAMETQSTLFAFHSDLSPDRKAIENEISGSAEVIYLRQDDSTQLRAFVAKDEHGEWAVRRIVTC